MVGRARCRARFSVNGYAKAAAGLAEASNCLALTTEKLAEAPENAAKAPENAAKAPENLAEGAAKVRNDAVSGRCRRCNFRQGVNPAKDCRATAPVAVAGEAPALQSRNLTW